MTYVLLKQSHIAAYQHDVLAKNEFPVPAFAYPVRKHLTKNGPGPACEQDPEIDKLKDAIEKVLDEAEIEDQRPAAIWEQHERDGHLPKIPDCPVCLE